MALLNYKKKEINAKIVYYGPGLSGKTTNIQFIHSKLRPDHRGKLMTLATQTDRTLFFDFLPVELGEIRGLKTRFQLYTVPGQVFYNATRKLVLKNVDGVVFVADSDPTHLADNIESLKNLEQNLKFHGKDIRDLPLVIQYNKRDLPNAMPIADLQAKVNTYGAAFTEASAGANGKGVLETLTVISKLVLQRLRDTQNITRVGDDAPDGTMPDPGMSPAEPAEGTVAKAAPAAAKSISLKPSAPAPAKPAEPVEEPEILDAPADEPELLDDESIDVDVDVDVEAGEETVSPATPAPKAAPAAAATPTVVFDKVLAAKPAGDGVDLTLAFKAGTQEIKVDLRLTVKPKP